MAITVFPSRAHRRPRALVLALALVSTALVAGAMPLQAAQEPQTAVVQDILDGKELFIDQQQARLKQKAHAPQLLSTGNSRGQLSFDTGAVGRLNRQSQLRLGSSCFVLDRGQVLVSGKQAGCTRSARLSVRGTNYVLDVTESGDTEVSVLEGEVEVQPSRDGAPIEGQEPTTVQSGQRLRLSAEGVVLTLLTLSSGDYTEILTGPLFKGFNLPLPAQQALDSYLRSAMPSVPIPAVPSVPRLGGFGFGFF
jgi:ferric-dicitrate binding protein FerR (iron transport regulator)